MKEGLIKDAYELIIKELQTVISIAYILTVGIGMLFNYKFYAEFDINIFDYSDVFDFLLAPFADYRILLFSVLSLLISLLLLKFDSEWKKRSPRSYSRANFGWDKKSWFKTFRYGSFAFCFIIYLFASADIYGRHTKKDVLAEPPVQVTFADNQTKSGIMIGKTLDVIFLKIDSKIEAIPITAQVKNISINTED